MRSNRERAASPRALGRQARPVWVDLRVLFPTSTNPDRVLAGVVVDEVVAGGLWAWVRTSSGEWLGVVTFHLSSAGRTGMSRSASSCRRMPSSPLNAHARLPHLFAPARASHYRSAYGRSFGEKWREITRGGLAGTLFVLLAVTVLIIAVREVQLTDTMQDLTDLLGVLLAPLVPRHRTLAR